MKTLTPTKLRDNIYGVLDEVIHNKKPIAIQRKGVLLTIQPPSNKKNKKKRDLSKLKKRKVIVGDPESILNIDWSEEWKPFL